MVTLPTQPLAAGVTDTIEVSSVYVGLIIKNGATVFEPSSGRPKVLVVADQVKVVPATGPLKVISGSVAPLQTLTTDGTIATGVGNTIMCIGFMPPVHPLANGVMTSVAVSILEPVFRAVNAGMLSVPEAAKPMEGLLLVQVKLAPATGLASMSEGRCDPLQTVVSGTTANTGAGYTKMLKGLVVRAHPLAIGVTVKWAVSVRLS